MSLKNLISENNIILDCDYKTKEEVIKALIKKLYEEGSVTSEEGFYKAVMEREKLSPTGLEEGLAIPHGKSEHVKRARVAVARLKNSLDTWESIDESNEVKLIFLIAIPKKEAGTTHIDILTKLSTSFMEEGFIEKLRNSKTTKDLLNIIYNIDKKEEKK